MRTPQTERLLVEADGKAIPQIWDEKTLGFVPLSGNNGSSTITTLKRAWRDDFTGIDLNPANWTLVQTGAGQGISVSGSNLVITSGTTPNSETIIQSVHTYPIPVRVNFVFAVSQRIINQEFYLELVNAAGDMWARWIIDGTVATNAAPQTGNAGVAGSNTAFFTHAGTALSGFEIEATPDTCYFASYVVEPGTHGATRLSNSRGRQLPDPNQLYHIRLRMRNLGVAPASSTTYTLDSVLVQDTSAMSVEIAGGRGDSNITLTRAIMANVGTVGAMTTGNMQSINTIWNDTTATLGANAIFTGTSRDFSATQRTRSFRAASMADQAGVLSVEQSFDGTLWLLTHSAATASVTDADAVARHIAYIDVPVVGRFVRVRYRNGATINTIMRIISLAGGI